MHALARLKRFDVLSGDFAVDDSAAAAPPRQIHGLCASQLLAEDVVARPRIAGGRIHPRTPGALTAVVLDAVDASFHLAHSLGLGRTR